MCILETQKMLEFTISEFLTLKLEDGKTYIYVKGKKFIQCKRLVINIIKQDIPRYDDIDSIDEAVEEFKLSLWQSRIVEGPMAKLSSIQNETITPEQEFWGHCSNLQTWYEHDYDTRLLHSNLAFPLLKALVDAGDTKAKTILKTEIADRFESGHPNVIISILSAKLLDYLSPDERKQLIQHINLQKIAKVLELKRFFDFFEEKLLNYLNKEEIVKLVQQNHSILFEYLQKTSEESFFYCYNARILNYLHPQEKVKLLQQKSQVILSKIEEYLRFLRFAGDMELRSRRKKYMLNIFEDKILDYLNSAEKNLFIRKNFPSVIVYIVKISEDFIDSQFSEEFFSEMYITVINAIKGTKLLDQFFNAIAERFHFSHKLSSFLFTLYGKASESLVDRFRAVWMEWMTLKE